MKCKRTSSIRVSCMSFVLPIRAVLICVELDQGARSSAPLEIDSYVSLKCSDINDTIGSLKELFVTWGRIIDIWEVIIWS